MIVGLLKYPPLKPGYAGIENRLFFQKKTSMLFGDAKKVLQDLVTEI